MSRLLPIPQVLIEMIQVSSNQVLYVLAELIAKAEIPSADRAAIDQALREKALSFAPLDRQPFVMEALASLGNQKQEAKEELFNWLTCPTVDILSLCIGGATLDWIQYSFFLSESGFEFVYQVCEKTRDELRELFGDEVIQRIEDDLKIRGLYLGMVFSDEVRAKLPKCPHSDQEGVVAE